MSNEENITNFINIKPIEKPTTYIYAKNGVGKTRWTREHKAPSSKIFLFNEDYVTKNIFIGRMVDEVKKNNTSQQNKINTHKILIAPFINEIIKEIVEIEEKMKKSEEDIVSVVGMGFDFDNAIEAKVPNFSDIIDSKSKKNNFYSKLDEETLEKEVKRKIVTFRNIENINKKIGQVNELHELMESVNLSIRELNKEVKSTSNKELQFIRIHKNVLEYIETSEDNSLNFMDEFNIEKEKLENYIKRIVDTKTEKLENYECFVEKYNKKRNEIILIISEVDGEELENKVEEYKKISYEANIKIERTEKLKEPTLVKRLETKNKEDIEKQISDFINKPENKFGLYKKDIKNLVAEYFRSRKNLKEKRDEKKQKTEKITNEVIKKMNSFIEGFGFDYLKIGIKNGNISGESGITTLEMEGDHPIETLSKGESGILAFSYFLTMFEIKIEKQKGDVQLIIDDPFDSNDHTKSHHFKSLSFNYEKTIYKSIGGLQVAYKKKTGKELKLILLTHNINVLYALTSNLIENAKEDENDNLMFRKVKHADSIEIREWINNPKKNGIIEEFVEISSFFPNEKVMKEKLEKLYDFFITNDCAINEAQLAWYMLMRLYDGNDAKKEECIRDFYKIKGEVKNIPH